MRAESIRTVRRIVLLVWALLIAGGLYFYFTQPEALSRVLTGSVVRSTVLAGAVYFVLFCIRGFTLIPSSYFLIAAIPILPPTTLFGLTLAGILVSSASIYYFSKHLGLDEYIERRHKAGVDKVKAAMQRWQMPIIIGWSFFPPVPTDVICYVCGILRVNFWKFLVGILIGEGAICAVYIFVGDSVLRYFSFR